MEFGCRELQAGRPRRFKSTSLVVKVLRPAVAVVGIRIVSKAHRRDRRVSLEKDPCHPMHAIHHPPVRAEDDWVREVDLFDQPEVIYDATHGRDLLLAIEPVDGVDLGDVIDRHVRDREIAAELNQPVDIPSIESTLARPEVVLLAHKRSISRHRAVASAGSPGRRLSSSTLDETMAAASRTAASEASATNGWDWIHAHARLAVLTTAQR